MDLSTIKTVTVFAVLFLVIGTLSPIMYTNLSPKSNFLEINDFDADDTYVGGESHKVCFDRNVKRPADAEITVELLGVVEGQLYEVDSFTVDAYFQKGEQDVSIERNIRRPNQLDPGIYKYRHSVTLYYHNERVTKDFTFNSDEFTVHESANKVPINGGARC